MRLENVQGNVVDFGCGRGVSTALLASYGANVTGVEIDPQSVEEGVKLDYVPSERVVLADGIQYLKSLPANSLDFVNASMLGPDINGHFIRSFLQACQHALKPGGVVMVTSDAGTMSLIDGVSPFNNGFTQNGIFLALAPVEQTHDTGLDASFGGQSKAIFDLGGLFDGIDVEGILEALDSRGNK